MKSPQITYFLLTYRNLQQFILTAEISRGLFAEDCHGQCGEGQGDCDKDLDCLPGFICKDGGFLGLRKDVCTAGEYGNLITRTMMLIILHQR